MQTHNFHDMLTVIKFTMRDIIGRKSFRISTAIIVVLIILGFNIPNFISSINDGDFSDTILISDPEQALTAEINDIIDTSVNYRKDHYKLELTQDDRDIIKEKINSDEVSSAIMIHRSDNTIFFDYYVKNLATAASETATFIPSPTKSSQYMTITKSTDSTSPKNNLRAFAPQYFTISHKPKIKKLAATFSS